jgi:REP element-mobilizing transposase RayT
VAERSAYRDRDGAASEVPLAYLITFRCYGTWLHGDQRGSIDRHQNAPGSPLLDPDQSHETEERRRLRHAAVELDAARRAIVDRTIREVCRFRKWTLHALNVRTNHVHLVVGTNSPPERVMNDLKSWSTRRMMEAGVLGRGMRAWSRHGSTRYLWKPEAVEVACRYVTEGQGAELPLQKLPSGRDTD